MRLFVIIMACLLWAGEVQADSLRYLAKKLDITTPRVMCPEMWDAQDYYLNIEADKSCDLRVIVDGAEVRTHFRWRDGVLRTVLENGDGWFWAEPFYISREPKRRRN